MLLALCLTGITDCAVRMAASAFEGNHISFDFNWLRLNEVILGYCVTCLECPFCNSCMRCVGDCSLGPKLTTYSALKAGWYAVRNGHSPTDGGMAAVVGGVRPLGSASMCQ